VRGCPFRRGPHRRVKPLTPKARLKRCAGCDCNAAIRVSTELLCSGSALVSLSASLGATGESGHGDDWAVAATICHSLTLRRVGCIALAKRQFTAVQSCGVPPFLLPPTRFSFEAVASRPKVTEANRRCIGLTRRKRRRARTTPEPGSSAVRRTSLDPGLERKLKVLNQHRTRYPPEVATELELV
jgi:hypothetical protein